MFRIVVVLLFLAVPSLGFAQSDGAINTSIIEEIQSSNLVDELSTELRVAGGLTLLSFIPLVIVSMTAFLRIVVVLSLLRHALGVQQTPPNIVLVTMALFLTFFTMQPVINKVEQTALVPYLQEQISMSEAIDAATSPVKAFMLSQTREKDMVAILNISQQEIPKSEDEVKMSILVPAFMLSELTTAFKIAFIIFIPFLLVDLVVATVLMSLGMIMVPPITIALPLKIMLFVVIDGWALVTESLIGSFF